MGESGAEISVSEQQRFDRLMEINRKLVFKKPEVLGDENLAKIPPNLPLIIATTHFSDADLQTVESQLRPRLKGVRPNHVLGISVESENLADPKTAFLIKLAGREHFFEYDVRFDKETNHLQFLFNPENFRKMAEALVSGTDIITAAHEPLANIPGSRWELPRRSGLGAAYLAQLTNATLLPVAVDIQTDQPVGMAADIGGAMNRLIRGKRPGVRVVIGEPFMFDQIDGESLKEFERLASRFGKLDNRIQAEEMSKDEEARARIVLKRIREQSDMVMRRIAVLLPEEKRGRW